MHEERALSDGTSVVLRHIRPTDAAELRRGFLALSPESRYRRFFHPVSDLSDHTLRYLTDVDGKDHVAIVAVGYAPDLKTEIGYGLARFVRLKDEPDVAEAAITVVDPMHNKGLGKLLSLVLADAARERGIRKFRAEVLASNAPVRQMLTDLGAEVRKESDDAVTIDIDLDDPRGPEPSAAKWLRAAADRWAGRFRSLPAPPDEERR